MFNGAGGEYKRFRGMIVSSGKALKRIGLHEKNGCELNQKEILMLGH